jgi:hypothetical protein
VSTSAVGIDNLGNLGSMIMSNGTLNVANDVTLNSLTQNGGTFAVNDTVNVANLTQTAGSLNSNKLRVTNSFAQSGTGTLGVTNDAVFDVGTNDFTLSNSGNSFGSLGVTANNVDISNITGNLTLANMNVLGTLGVNIASDILQKAGTTIEVAGATTLASTSGDVKLDGANNDFSTINVTAKDIVLADKNAIELGTITSTGTFEVDAVDNISQKAGTALSITGDLTLASSSGNVTLDSATNNFTGSLNASGNNITLDNYAHALTLGNITSQTLLDITTTGNITQSNGTTLVSNGITNIDAGTADVTLSNSGNDFNKLILAGNNLAFSDSIGGVTLGNISTSGTFSAVSSGGDITQSTGAKLSLTGDASFNSGTHNTILTNTGNDFTTLELTGNNVSFKDDVGTTTLGNVITTGIFSATNTVGGITQSSSASMSIGTDAVFNVGTNDFKLSNVGNSLGSLGVTANNVDISNITGNLTLANMNVLGTLGVNINNDILQKAGTIIEVAGATTLASTTGDIKLDGANNNFKGLINLDAINATINSINKLNLGNIKLISKLQGSKISIDGGNTGEKVDSNAQKVIDNIDKITKINVPKNFVSPVNNLVQANNSSSTPVDKQEVKKVDSVNPNTNRVTLNDNSMIQLINGGVNLPIGLTQISEATQDKQIVGNN